MGGASLARETQACHAVFVHITLHLQASGRAAESAALLADVADADRAAVRAADFALQDAQRHLRHVDPAALQALQTDTALRRAAPLPACPQGREGAGDAALRRAQVELLLQAVGVLESLRKFHVRAPVTNKLASS